MNVAFTPSLGIKWDSTLLRFLSTPIQNRKVAHAPGAVATEYGGLAWCVVAQHVDAVYGPIA